MHSKLVRKDSVMGGGLLKTKNINQFQSRCVELRDREINVHVSTYVFSHYSAVMVNKNKNKYIQHFN